MALALQESSSDSLVLVDEFGAGTAAADGRALLAAALGALLARGARCPHVLAATHYTNIKDFIVDTPLVSFLVCATYLFITKLGQ